MGLLSIRTPLFAAAVTVCRAVYQTINPHIMDIVILNNGWLLDNADHKVQRRRGGAGGSLSRDEYVLLRSILSARLLRGSREAKSLKVSKLCWDESIQYDIPRSHERHWYFQSCTIFYRTITIRLSSWITPRRTKRGCLSVLFSGTHQQQYKEATRKSFLSLTAFDYFWLNSNEIKDIDQQGTAHFIFVEIVNVLIDEHSGQSLPRVLQSMSYTENTQMFRRRPFQCNDYREPKQWRLYENGNLLSDCSLLNVRTFLTEQVYEPVMEKRSTAGCTTAPQFSPLTPSREKKFNIVDYVTIRFIFNSSLNNSLLLTHQSLEFLSRVARLN